MIKPTTNDEDDFRRMSIFFFLKFFCRSDFSLITAFLLLEIKFHEHYPDQSPEIAIVDSVNVDDRSPFESEIKTIVNSKLLLK
jgi:hypothetical protein